MLRRVVTVEVCMQAEDGWGGAVWSALAMSGSTISAGGVSSIYCVLVFIQSGIIAWFESHLQCCCPVATLVVQKVGGVVFARLVFMAGMTHRPNQSLNQQSNHSTN